MAKLTAEKRSALPEGKFALPGKRAFPIQDEEHARKALQLGPRSVKAGNTTPAEMEEIRRKVHARYPSVGAGKKTHMFGARKG